MRASWISLLRCPEDGSGPLMPSADVVVDGRLTHGRLTCPRCARCFTVDDGIPSLLPRRLDPACAAGADDGASAGAGEGLARADVDMLRERAARDAESAVYDEHYDDRAYRFELETYVRQLAPAGGERILDVGCGTGRVTKEYLDRAGSVIGADHSLDSLRHFARRLSPAQRGRVGLVRCAVGQLPFPDAAFDAVVSTSLFSNLPTAEARDRGLHEVQRVLRPGGRFLVTVYNHCWTKRVRQRAGLSRSGLKQGYHSGGRVPYYNFDPLEFSAWVATRFEPGPVFGLNHRLPLLSSSSAAVAVRVDRWLSRMPAALGLAAKEMGMLARARAGGGAGGSSGPGALPCGS